MLKSKKSKKNNYINITPTNMLPYNTFVHNQKKYSQQRHIYIYNDNKNFSTGPKHGINSVVNRFFQPPQKYTNLQLSQMMRDISPHNRANSSKPLLFINSYHLGPQYPLGKGYKLLSVTSQAEAESIVLMLQQLGYLPQNTVIFRNDLMLAKCHAEGKILDVKALYQIPLKSSVIQALAKNYGPMWTQTLQKQQQGKNNTHNHVNSILKIAPQPNHSNINPANPAWPNPNPANTGIPPAYHTPPTNKGGATSPAMPWFDANGNNDAPPPYAPGYNANRNSDATSPAMPWSDANNNNGAPPPYAPGFNANADDGRKPSSSPMPNPYNTISHSKDEDIENDDGRPEGAPMGNTFDPDNINDNVPYDYLNGGYADNNASCGKASGWQNIFANPNMLGNPAEHQPGAPAPLPKYNNDVCTPG